MQNNVSVTICTKGADKYIGHCIRSLLDQTFNDFEIIIVEDPPFDRTKRIITAFGEKKIRYIRNQKYLGLTKSRNRCVELAEGNYIFFTDADCIVSKKWVEQGLKSLREQDLIGVEGRTYYVSEKYQPRYSDAHSYVENSKGGQFMTCNMAYKKSIIEYLGGFDERYVNAEDRNLALRAMKIGKIQFNPEMVVYHQKITRKPKKFGQMLKNIKYSHPVPLILLYKESGNKPFSLWRIVNPLNLATILFPPLVLTHLLFNFNSFKGMEDFNLLPYVYLDAMVERLQLWQSCARERVFLI